MDAIRQWCSLRLFLGMPLVRRHFPRRYLHRNNMRMIHRTAWHYRLKIKDFPHDSMLAGPNSQYRGADGTSPGASERCDANGVCCRSAG